LAHGVAQFDERRRIRGASISRFTPPSHHRIGGSGAPDTTIMAIPGHVDRGMMEHYSHTRLTAKRNAVLKLDNGLMLIRQLEREEGR
jgi:hypothetical protein